MEVLFGALLTIGFVLLIFFGPWIYAATVNRRRRADRAELEGRISAVQSRMEGVEKAALRLDQELKDLRRAGIAPATTAIIAAEAAATPVPAVTPIHTQPPASDETLQATSLPTAAAPPPLEPAPGGPHTESPAASSPSPSGYGAWRQPGIDAPLAPATTSVTQPAPSPDETPAQSARKRSFDIEETLGANWLSKLGIGILVLGIAFFLAWQLREVGPAGKVVVGWLVGAALLALGVFFERRERYRMLARAGVGGGWALLFFTAYAMYHVPATKVMSSELADMALMLVVGVAMVVHTLRYRSQVVTSIAFLLAFATTSLNRAGVWSLGATAMLALGVAVIAVRMSWFELEVLGILAAYLNHFWFLRPIIERMGGERHPFPEFVPSAIILIFYWAVFRTSYILRKPHATENISTVAAILNTFLLLSVMKYQSLHPDLAFYFLLALGAVELTLGQLPITRRRRQAFIVLTTLGAMLLIAAIPFRFAPEKVSLIWLAEAEVFFLAGVFTREVVFRRLGIAGAVVAGMQMLAVETARVMGARMDGAYVVHHYALGSIFALAALMFYVNAHWATARWPELFEHPFDSISLRDLSYGAAVLALAAGWVAFFGAWTVVAWMLIATAIGWAARRWQIRDLALQSIGISALAFIRVLWLNLQSTESLQWGRVHISERLLTVAVVAFLLYVVSRLTRGAAPTARFLPDSVTWLGSTLVTLLVWYEFRLVSVALGWAAFGLVAFELGTRRASLQLRLQGYTALLCAFLRIFYVNLNAPSSLHQIGPRVYTVLPLALAFYYVYERLHDDQEDSLAFDRRIKASQIFAHLGTIALVAIVRFEAQLDWVAAAWSALVLMLVVLAWRSERRIFLRQALVLSAAVLVRAVLHNFYERSYFPAPGLYGPFLTVGTAVALLAATLPFAFQLRSTEPLPAESGFKRALTWLDRRPEQTLFFVPVAILTVLLAVEMRSGMVTLSWGLEGIVIFVLALWIGERSYRLTGLGLLLLCVGKLLVDDMWKFNLRDRAITFIALGLILVLASVLYTKKREAIRQYL